MIHIITGNGKGKTSAAAGMALRMCGRGKSVLFAQFLKGADSGEVTVLRSIPNITVMRLSRDYGFFKSMTAEEISAVKGEHNAILRAALEGEYDMLILDELIPAMNNGLIDTKLLDAVLSLDRETVLTGREPAPELIERADYVSEIVKIKHPFDKGVAARRGVEF